MIEPIEVTDTDGQGRSVARVASNAAAEYAAPAAIGAASGLAYTAVLAAFGGRRLMGRSGTRRLIRGAAAGAAAGIAASVARRQVA